MHGLMQDWPLRVQTIIDHAARYHAKRPIISKMAEGNIQTSNYQQLNQRARKLAGAIQKNLNIKKGNVIATMAWNTTRHLEVWYGVMGIGAVVHTLNPRLFHEQLIYIINHAEDQWIFIEPEFLTLINAIKPKLKTVKGLIILTSKDHMPENTDPDIICYEDLIETGNPNTQWAKFDEQTACGMCYTSGTTGNPKGVVYSHRSNVIHAMQMCLPGMAQLGAHDTMMPVVPMFHANGWSFPFSILITGAKMVLPAGQMDGESIYQLLHNNNVTKTAAVPTVWLMLLQYLEKNPQYTLPNLKKVIIGGSACPKSMMDNFSQKYGAQVIHAWGMTEMSPMGTMATKLPHLSDKQWQTKQLTQGRPCYGVEMKITDENGNTLPNDGTTFGNLKVRGPAITRQYYKQEQNILDHDGFFDTGDVATLDQDGYMYITDRSKDVIKSGGEWISSIELENAAMDHPNIAEAAVIGVKHPKWDERPLLIVVIKEGKKMPNLTEIHNTMKQKIAKWQLPDDIVQINEIPHTATGKISKKHLREKFENHTLQTAKT